MREVVKAVIPSVSHFAILGRYYHSLFQHN